MIDLDRPLDPEQAAAWDAARLAAEEEAKEAERQATLDSWGLGPEAEAAQRRAQLTVVPKLS